MKNKTTTELHVPPEFGGLRLVAGHPALDFVNTVKFRNQTEPGDRLTDFKAALAWSTMAGVMNAGSAQIFTKLALHDQFAATAAFDEIILLREALRQVLPARETAEDVQKQAVKVINELLAELATLRRFDTETIGLSIDLPIQCPRDLIFWIGLTIEDLLTRDESKKIGYCDGSDCDWVYLDGGRGRKRRWCDSRTCGNTARVRQYRNKKTGA